MRAADANAEALSETWSPAPDSSHARAELLAHWNVVRQGARKLMRDSIDAEDLAHDTFERALRSLDRFRMGTNMRAWLYTIMVRLAHDHFRRKQARRPGEADLERLPAPGDEEDLPGWCRVTTAQIRAALDQVSAPLREVFELHELEHLSYAGVARRLDIPVNTVASRLRRARERLRELLSAVSL